ncbi:N-acetylglucosaminidase [Pseudogracilibacillus sp. SO30301A]|uniref:N-acetylglucosaminidase n=1 Tax=Pseudogracilibacillus sp. SO30301A TaxID=3098291 RepID=UPI00300DF3B0
MRKISIILATLFLLVPATINAQKAETAYTDYSITLEEAVDIQLNKASNPITDIYRNDPAYIATNDVKFTGPNEINALTVNIRTEPTLDSKVAFQFIKTTPVNINKVVQGDEYEDSPLWYEIYYKTDTYYIHSNLVDVQQIKTARDTNIHAGPSKNNHEYGTIQKGETLTIANLDVNWIEVFFDGWRRPKPGDIKKILDPNDEENIFQHIRLDESIGVTEEDLNLVLEDRGILEGRAQAFIDGGKKHGLNEAYLIAHALHETGQGTSELANGIEVGLNKKGKPTVVTPKNEKKLKEIKTTYNMYGIGAADSCPLKCGAITAYENKWFTPEKAIEEGAEWIGKDYIYNEFEQNTLYKMKWNPKMGEGYYWKQYATDIGWAEKQTKQIKEIYEQLKNPTYHYDIPAYKEG